MADPRILIIASATAKPGKEAELVSALREVAGPTRSQPGCIRFGLTGNRMPTRPSWASSTGPPRAIMIAIWPVLTSSGLRAAWPT
jgi:hypothetical protein